MTRISRPSRRTLAIIPAILSLCVVVLGVGPARAAGGLEVDEVQPLKDGALTVARVAAPSPGGTDQWIIKGDIWVTNMSNTTADIATLQISYPASGLSSSTVSYVADLGASIVIPPGGTDHLRFHDGLNRDLLLPAPATVRLTAMPSGWGSGGVDVTLTMRLHANDTPTGGYFFPAKSSDLAAGQHWAGGDRHIYNLSTVSQRFAWDLAVYRWDGSAWVDKVAGADLTTLDNSDFIVWNLPLYSPGNGVIRQCLRGNPDQVPGGSLGGHYWGNHLLIQYGDEFMAFAHLRQNTIPAALCPQQAPAQINVPVSAGQFLGRVGNTGNGSGPHLHIHLQAHQTDTFETGDGLPLLFHNIRQRAHATSINSLGGTPTLSAVTAPATLYRNVLIQPNPCGFSVPAPLGAEVSRHGIPEECYQDAFNEFLTAGYRPVSVDGSDAAGSTFFNAVFRPAGTIPWVARHNLTQAEFQTEFNTWTGQGFRLHQVEAYRVSGGTSVRYAALFESRAGPAWAAYHGLSDAAHTAQFQSLAAAGYVPVNMAPVVIGGSLSWTALYEKVALSGWVLAVVPESQYQSTFESNVAAGRVPYHVNGFNSGATPYLSAVFVAPVGSSWTARHGRTSSEYQADYAQMLSSGLLTRAVTGYERSGTTRFAAIWRAAPNTTIVSGPANQTAATTAAFSFSGTDPFSQFECRLDVPVFSGCKSPKTYAGIGAGTHTFTVRALDRESVVDATPPSWTWLVDTTGPSVTILRPQPGRLYVNDIELRSPSGQLTVIAAARVVATAADAQTGVAGLVFDVDGVQVPSAQVQFDPVHNTWSFLWRPSKIGIATYTITAKAFNGVGTTQTASVFATGISTGLGVP